MKRLPEVGFGPAHGYLYLHVAPRAVAKHLEWSISEVLGYPVSLNWQPQTLQPGTLRAELSWSSLIGSGSKLASSLKGWHYLTLKCMNLPEYLVKVRFTCLHQIWDCFMER